MTRPLAAARAVLGAHHPIVWWAVALQLAFSLAYLVLVPIYRGPDEANHVDMLRHYRAEARLPDPSELVPRAAAVVATQRIMGPDVRERPPQRALDAPARSARPAFDDLPAGDSREDNQLSQHPPLYYALTGGAVAVVDRLVPGTWSWDREVTAYRLVSVLLAIALPLLASAAALAVGLSRAGAAVAAAFVLLVPMRTFLGVVVNNDALLVPLAACATLAVLRYVGGGSAAWAYAAAAAAAGTALTKSTAAVLLPWVAIAVLVEGHRRRGGDARRPRYVTLAAAGGLLAAGASWYVVNIVRFGEPQPTGVHVLRLGPRASVADYLPRWLDFITRSFWGAPARRIDVSLDWRLTAVLSAATVAVALVAAFSPRALRRVVVLLVALCVAQVLLAFTTNYRADPGARRLSSAQGRYLYALLVPVAVLVALGFRRLAGRSERRLAAVATAVATAGVGLHVLLARSMLHGYWEGPGASAADRLDALVAWSSFPEPVTYLLLSLPVAASIAGVARVAWVGWVGARRVRRATG